MEEKSKRFTQDLSNSLILERLQKIIASEKRLEGCREIEFLFQHC